MSGKTKTVFVVGCSRDSYWYNDKYGYLFEVDPIPQQLVDGNEWFRVVESDPISTEHPMVIVATRYLRVDDVEEQNSKKKRPKTGCDGIICKDCYFFDKPCDTIAVDIKYDGDDAETPAVEKKSTYLVMTELELTDKEAELAEDEPSVRFIQKL